MKSLNFPGFSPLILKIKVSWSFLTFKQWILNWYNWMCAMGCLNFSACYTLYSGGWAFKFLVFALCTM